LGFKIAERRGKMCIIARMLVVTGTALFLLIAPSFGGSGTNDQVVMAAEELESVHMEIAPVASDADAAKVKAALAKVPGVKEANVSAKGSADLKVAKGTSLDALKKAVQDAGFTVAEKK
jgi:copper chaperone CopZ